MDSGRGHRVSALWKLNMNQLIKLEAAKAYWAYLGFIMGP